MYFAQSHTTAILLLKCLLVAMHNQVILTSEQQIPELPQEANRSIEKSLISDLMNKYKISGRVGRPVQKTKDTVTVNFGLALIQILDLDENKQILRTNCWLRYLWKDILLDWSNLSEYKSISSIRVYPKQIWTPDIKLFNFADERMTETREARVVVSNDGTVLWEPQAILKSTCPVEIIYFPFDIQACYIEVGSWTYDDTQLNLTFWMDDTGRHEIPYIDYNDYVESNEWITDGEMEGKNKNVPKYIRKYQVKSEKRIKTLTYIFNHKTITRNHARLQYKIVLTRKPLFYVSILIVPCILLSCLTMVIFWLPPESPAKMQLGMNIFVAFFVLLLLLAESTPSAVERFPLIGSYYCLNMCMITMSTFLAVIVINLYFRGDKSGPVPPRIRLIFIEGMGRLFFIRQHIPLLDEQKLLHAIVGDPNNRTGNRKVHLPKLKYNKFEMNEADSRTQLPVMTNSINDAAGCSGLVEPQDSPILSSPSNSIEKDVREIKRYIHLFVSRHKDRERKNLCAMEWRTVAIVLDRMFFSLYVIAIFTALVTMLPRRQ